MNLSVFEVIGPVMVGPSSSHTAGAAKLARIARCIADQPFSRVTFGLHGSFAKTYRGHGTDRALLAGAMGLREDDEQLAAAFAIAKEKGLQYAFHEIELEEMHENSVQINFFLQNGGTCEVIGSSIGGAQIVIRRINGFEVDFNASLPTLVISQRDRKGIVSEVTRILANGGLNIGVMKLSRNAKGDRAVCVIETDERIERALVDQIRNVPNVLSVRAVNVSG